MTQERSARLLTRMSASYGIAAVLLWLFFRQTEWRVLVNDARSVGWFLLAAAVIVRLLSLLAASWRWQVLLAPVHDVPLGGIVAAMMMGMAVNTVAPMQAAEVVRPYLLSTRQGIDFSATLATVMVEWVLDALGVLALFIPALLWFRGLGSTPAGAGVPGLDRALALFAVIAIAGVYVLARLPRWASRLAERLRCSVASRGDGRARMADQCLAFASGLRILDRRRGLAAVSAASLLVSALTAISAWMALAAFGLPVSWASGFLILGLITVAGMTPTPGAIGGFHALCQLGLVSFFHVDRAKTVLPVVALHAVMYLPAAAIGALCFLTLSREPRRSDG